MTIYGREWWLLEQVRDRLRMKVDGFTQSSCFICDVPYPDQFPPQVPICTICLGGVRYDEPTYMGAGPNALAEYSTLIVTPITRVLLDPPPKAQEALMHGTRGLLMLKLPILNALLVSDDQYCEGHKDQWVPRDEDGNHYLIERGLIPRGWSPPQYAKRGDHQYLGMSLTLSFGFDQEL